jgi:hypothetical protein
LTVLVFMILGPPIGAVTLAVLLAPLSRERLLGGLLVLILAGYVLGGAQALLVGLVAAVTLDPYGGVKLWPVLAVSLLTGAAFLLLTGWRELWLMFAVHGAAGVGSWAIANVLLSRLRKRAAASAPAR